MSQDGTPTLMNDGSGNTPAAPAAGETPPNTPAATPPAGTPDPTPAPAPAAAPVTDPPAPGAPAPAAGEPPKPGEPASTETGSEAQAPKAPEKYELTIPEGVTMSDESRGQVETLARELDLDNDQAQKLLTHQTAAIKASDAAIVAEWDTRIAGWKEQVEKDPELGGPHLAENIAHGERVIEKYGDDGLREALRDTGFNFHPAVVRFLVNVGKASKEDEPASGSPPTEPQPAGVGKRVYPGWR